VKVVNLYQGHTKNKLSTVDRQQTTAESLCDEV